MNVALRWPGKHFECGTFYDTNRTVIILRSNQFFLAVNLFLTARAFIHYLYSAGLSNSYVMGLSFAGQVMQVGNQAFGTAGRKPT